MMPLGAAPTTPFWAHFGHPGAGSVLPALASSFLEGKASKAAGLDQHSGGNDLLVKCRGEACTAQTPAQERLLCAAQHGLMGFPAQGLDLGNAESIRGKLRTALFGQKHL